MTTPDLISVTTRTVLENMLVGMVLIFLVQWLFLGDLRSAAIASATIPFALLFAVTILMLRGESGQPAVGGRHRFRPGGGRDRDHGRNVFWHLTGEVSARGERERRRAEAEAEGMHGKLATILVAAQEVGNRFCFPPPSSWPPLCRYSPCQAWKVTSLARWRRPAGEGARGQGRSGPGRKAQYQSAVTTAFRNTADALEAVYYDADALVANAAAGAAASEALERARGISRLWATPACQLFPAGRAE